MPARHMTDTEYEIQESGRSGPVFQIFPVGDDFLPHRFVRVERLRRKKKARPEK